MTAGQKWVAALGALAIFITCFFAPYRVGAHNDLERIAHGGYVEPYQFTAHAPLWDAPHAGSSMPGFDGNQMDSVQLDAGQLGIWWAGIAVVTVLGVVLAAPKREA